MSDKTKFYSEDERKAMEEWVDSCPKKGNFIYVHLGFENENGTSSCLNLLALSKIKTGDALHHSLQCHEYLAKKMKQTILGIDDDDDDDE